MEWIIQLPVLFFSVVIHEFCHGWVAYSHGDDTAEKAGRLTLNPLAHMDAFGTVFLPVLCFFTQSPMFGWAKPVPVNPKRFKEPIRDMMRVALAGPGANLLIAFAAAILFKFVTISGMFTPAYKETIRQALLFAVSINLILAFFNLIPIHPLDGSKVIFGLLPERARRTYGRHVPYGMFIILMLVLTRKLSAFVLWPMRLVLGFWVKIGLLG
ncbi:MAG: site-2 protease family protein [Elusimicrobiota bacterium]